MTKFTRIALSSSAAVALLAGASSLSANAAPLGANLESLKTAAPSATESVQYRRYRNRNIAIGLGAFGTGVIVGSAIANRGYYYEDHYGYYGQPYGYYPAPYGYYSAPSSSQTNGYEDLSDVAR